MKDERALFTVLMNHFLLMYPQAVLTNLRHLTLPTFLPMRAGLIVYFFISVLLLFFVFCSAMRHMR